ncbi:MAG: HPr kinase/phosphorylase [Gammaproteobacteria bacterium]|nr:MAG: HPr kinase/phosphorylase [Gammaproteobacteria bacterium]TND02945.1 MAG: HPr kinase/phosphorylase [Gammaproteobacteria bacterium]
MAGPLTAAGLFEARGEVLGLAWLAGRNGADRALQLDSVDLDHAPIEKSALVGQLDLAHPNQVQVIGPPELDNLQGLSGNSRRDAIKQLFSHQGVAVIVAQGAHATDELTGHAEKTGTPLFSSSLSSDQVVRHLHHYLTGFLSVKTMLHGVFLEVLGAGVLITGASGIGKSELALELISRGHRLIADDVTEFHRVDTEVLRGTCPAALRDFLEVRGLGVLNIRAMFGDSAIKRAKNLRLIICLKQLAGDTLHDMDRLRGSRTTRELLDIAVPEITLPVAPGRNLAVLVEAAVRNHVLSLRGYNAPEDFITKQRQYMQQGEQ